MISPVNITEPLLIGYKYFPTPKINLHIFGIVKQKGLFGVELLVCGDYYLVSFNISKKLKSGVYFTSLFFI